MSLALYYADRKPVLIDKTTTLLVATRFMLSNNKYHAVLVEENNKLAGILSIRDVAKAMFIVGEEAVELIEAGFLAKILENPAYMYATRNVLHISEDDGLDKALKIMVENNIGSLPILGSEKRVVGVLEEKQVIKAMPIHTKKSTCDYVTWDLVTIDGDDEILEAIGMMINNNIRRVVVAREGEPEALTTLNVLIDYIISPSSLDKLLEGDESPLSRPVKKVSLKPWMVDCSYSLREIASVLVFDPLGAVLVRGEEEKIGILTERDLLRALRDHFASQ